MVGWGREAPAATLEPCMRLYRTVGLAIGFDSRDGQVVCGDDRDGKGVVEGFPPIPTSTVVVCV